MEPPDVMILIGQILGVIAVILGFVSFQMKTAKQVVFMQCAVAAVFCAHYLFLGAISGGILNAVCFVRNVAYSFRDKKFLSGVWVTVFFVVLMTCLGIGSWQGWPSLFVIVGLVLNTVAMRFKDPQNIRRSILVTSPLVIIYDLIVRSYGGIVYESVVIVSSIIGLIRARRSAGEETAHAEEQ
jgi:hypothetical protein